MMPTSAARTSSAGITGASEILQRSYPAIPDAVPVARGDVVRLAREAGASGRLLEDVRLAVSEALTNVVVHAYRDTPAPGRFEVTAAHAEDELWILISDAGCGLHPRDDSPGLGLGLALMMQLSGEMDVADRSVGGTEIRLRFPLAERREPVELFADRRPESDQSSSRGSRDSAIRPASSRFSTTR